MDRVSGGTSGIGSVDFVEGSIYACLKGQMTRIKMSDVMTKSRLVPGLEIATWSARVVLRDLAPRARTDDFLEELRRNFIRRFNREAILILRRQLKKMVERNNGPYVIGSEYNDEDGRRYGQSLDVFLSHNLERAMKCDVRVENGSFSYKDGTITISWKGVATIVTVLSLINGGVLNYKSMKESLQELQSDLRPLIETILLDTFQEHDREITNLMCTPTPTDRLIAEMEEFSEEWRKAE
jgi:hypothetical protein